MKLYHGTSEKIAKIALQDGFKPRKILKKKSNWKMASNDQLIYLTSAYAGYFAANASSNKEHWAIIEIDTEKLEYDNFRPDEDFLEQYSRNLSFDETCKISFQLANSKTMKQRTRYFRDNLNKFAHLWLESLDSLGNCSYKGIIPPSAITKVAIYDPYSNEIISMAALDPLISIFNFKFCGEKYIALTSWFMDENPKPTDLGFQIEFLPELKKESILKEINNKSGLKIINNERLHNS